MKNNKPKQVHQNDVPLHEFLRYVEELETYVNTLEKQLDLYGVSESNLCACGCGRKTKYKFSGLESCREDFYSR